MKIIILLTGFWCACLLSGCTRAEKNDDTVDKKLAQHKDKFVELYYQYLDADVNVARRTLLQMLEDSKTIKTDSRRYAFEQARINEKLYVLEAKMGDTNIASNYFNLAVKWRVAEHRFMNMSQSELDQIKSDSTPEAITESVLKSDRMNHGGKDPAYLHQ